MTMTMATADLPETVPKRGWLYAAIRLATVGDQIVVALTNFGLTIAIGRAFGAEELASYGIGLSIGLMVQGLQRHAITIPLMLHPANRIARRRGGIVAEQALVILAALALGAAALLCAQLMGAGRFAHLVVLASVVCLVVYVQLEFGRAFLIKTGRPWFLLAGSLWYAGVALALALAALSGRIGFETLLLALGAAMLAHAAAVTLVNRAFALREGFRLLGADVRRYGGWAGIATATYAGYNHVPLLILGAIAAPIHAAIFVAARSLMQPLQILLRGLDIADKTAFAETRGGPYSRERARVTLRLVALYALIGVSFGALAGFGAERLLALAYGAKFAGYGGALIAWAPAYVLLSVTMPLESLVYARQEFRRYFIVRGIASVVAIALSIPLIWTYAEIGAIAACAIGWLIAVAGTGLVLFRGARP